MFKRILISLIIISLFICFIPYSYAENKMTLPGGQEIIIDNLSDQDIYNAIRLARKSAGSSSSVADIVKGVNPNDLEAWSKLITGTIKNICNDLNVTVNEFVKTPVGIGIAVLIVYKVAGKDLLDNTLDVIIMVPLWFLITGIILFLGWYFFSNITVYNKIYYDEKGKKVLEGQSRITRYQWIDKENGAYFAITLIICEAIITLISLMVIL